jgi:hypothetical protein
MSMTFHSTLHPHGQPWVLVYGRALVDTLGWCVLPLMVGALAATLQRGDPLPYLVYGLPVALVVASGWTHFRLRTRLAEVHVAEAAAAVRSVWEVMRASPLTWLPVLDLRKTRTTFQFTLGHTPHEQFDAVWPEREALLTALQHARDQYLYTQTFP